MAEMSVCIAVMAALVTMVRSMALPSDGGESIISLTMPGTQPQLPDTYLCYSHKLPKVTEYITGFLPHANKSTAHHMLLYGCTEPGSVQAPGTTWNCGEMMSTQQVETGPVCKQGGVAKILYAWAMDAPSLELPEGVGFMIGENTDIKYLVLQVHYKNVDEFIGENAESDHSGMTLTVTDEQQPRLAGVYLMGTAGEIPAHETVYMETACSYNDQDVLHPFAYRTHAHIHGEVVSGYRVRDGQWEEIGRKSPQKPQMFYPVAHPEMTIQNGDVLAARCTMVNNEDRTVKIGMTQHDEMCNFYIMYYKESSEPLSQDNCFTAGPPKWNWNDEPLLNMLNVPHNASVIPGTDKVLEATHKFIKQEEENLEEMSEELEDNFLRLLNEIRMDQENQNTYPEERGRYEEENSIPYGMEEKVEYIPSDILQEYPELMDMYQRQARSEYVDDSDWLQAYYDQMQS